MPNKNTGKGPRNKIRVETPPVDGIGFLPTAVSTSCRGQKSPLRVETFPGSRRPSGRSVLIRCLFGMCCTRNCCFFFLMFFCCLHLILEVNIQERKKDEYIFLFEADNCWHTDFNWRRVSKILADAVQVLKLAWNRKFWHWIAVLILKGLGYKGKNTHWKLVKSDRVFWFLCARKLKMFKRQLWSAPRTWRLHLNQSSILDHHVSHGKKC